MSTTQDPTFRLIVQRRFGITNPPASLSGSLPFGVLESMVDVRTTITLTGGATGAGIDDFNTQTDVVGVPEPGGIGLMAVALAAMAGWRRAGVRSNLVP